MQALQMQHAGIAVSPQETLLAILDVLVAAVRTTQLPLEAGRALPRQKKLNASRRLATLDVLGPVVRKGRPAANALF